ncbi:unnamed protein product [Effrenium voratum]|uniref:Uncharacterized protein n=1 Tax=Effrenium voratum TaxID=2562239 RepID=A0AA36NJM9_9DINO|nr:unnamed protein product [Effrenium voratum]
MPHDPSADAPSLLAGEGKRIADALRELQQHRNHLDVTKDVLSDRQQNIQLQAGWATREWAVLTGAILEMAMDAECLRACRFDNAQDALAFVNLLIRTASNRSWSMAIWSEIPPFNFAGILHESGERRAEALARMRDDYEVVQRAIELQDDPNYNSEDCWAHGAAFNWDLNALFAHVHRVFDGPVSSKESAEDVIGTLSDARERGNRNPFNAVSPERAYIVQQPTNSFLLLHAHSHMYSRPSTSRAALRLRPSGMLADEAATHERNKPKTEKPASQEADLRSVATLLTLRDLRPLSFAGVGSSWCTCFLSLLGLYQDTVSNKYYLSLGVYSTGGLGWLVDEVSPGLFVLCRPGQSKNQLRRRIQLLRLSDVYEPGKNEEHVEVYQGVPWEVSLPTSNPERSLLLKRSGGNMTITKYFLKHGSLEFVTDHQVAALTLLLNFTPERYAESKLGVKSRLTLGNG